MRARYDFNIYHLESLNSVNTYVGTFLRTQHTQNPCPYQRLCISADTGKRVLKILKSQCYHLEDGNQCPAYVSTLLCEHRCGILSLYCNVCKKLRARAHAARATAVGNGLTTFWLFAPGGSRPRIIAHGTTVQSSRLRIIRMRLLQVCCAHPPPAGGVGQGSAVT